MDMSTDLRVELKRLKGSLYQLQTQYEEEIPASLWQELAEVSGTIENLAMHGHLDIRKG
jgi:hypothetical protein